MQPQSADRDLPDGVLLCNGNEITTGTGQGDAHRPGAAGTHPCREAFATGTPEPTRAQGSNPRLRRDCRSAIRIPCGSPITRPRWRS